MNLFLKSKNLNIYLKNNFRYLSNEVILNKINHCGIITLNRPKALNSLNKNMVDIIYPILLSWNQNKDISHVIIEGTGEKAFCAGGDIRQVTEEGKIDIDSAATFFKNEYKLNYLIGSLSKPYVSLINGITMGGGFGLSVHGKYRITTEKTVFAMPETAIGFYPDVGGSYYLSRLPGNLGIYLALVGTRFKGEDVVSIGVGTHYVNSSKIAQIKDELIKADNAKEVDKIIQRFNTPIDQGKFSLASQLLWINEHFSSSSVEDIIKSLSKEVQSSKSESQRNWSQKHIEILRKMSPTSLKISLRQLHEGKKMKFNEAFTMEYRISKMCLRHHDFYEGVRALIVDKDNKPTWNPNSLEEVTNEMVDEYFKPISDDLFV